MSTTKPADPLRIVSKVAQSAHLEAVRFLRGSFQVDVLPNALAANQPTGRGPAFGFETSLAGDHLLSQISFTLDVQQVGTPPLHVVEVKATIELSYKVSAKFEESEFDCFAKINGIYHAWPYWREFVQNVTTRASLPPLTLHPIHAGEAVAMAGFASLPATPKPKAKTQ